METSVGHFGVLGYIVLRRSIILRVIPFVALVAVAGCAIAAPTPSPAGGPPLVLHSLEGREGQCLLCHEAGIAGAPRVSANHAGRTSDICTLCHVPAVASAHSPGVTPTATPMAAPATPASTTTATLPKPPPNPPANHIGRTVCLLCHETGVGGAPKFPGNHTGRTDAMCPTCHIVPNLVIPTPSPIPTSTSVPATPAPTTAATLPKPPPNPPANHIGRTVCLLCHETGVGGAPRPPSNHVGRTDAMCTTCHMVPK